MDPTIPHPPRLPELRLRGARDRRAAVPAPVPVMPGVSYVPSPTTPLWQQRREASLARCAGVWSRSRSRLALAGTSAALIHGLWVTEAEPDLLLLTRTEPSRATTWLPGVTFRGPRSGHPVPGRTRVRLRRRRRAAHECDVTAVGPLLVTSLMQTAVDCAFELPPRRSVPIVDSAMRALVVPERFHEEESAARWARLRVELINRVEAQGTRPGAVRARAVTSIASPFSESAGESALRWQVYALGLPTPSVQLRVNGERTYFLDVAMPGLKVNLEYDGRGKYLSPEAAWAEKIRQDDLARLGWRTGRFTGRHLADPALMAQDILRLVPAHVAAAARPDRALR
ncbi:hypothetical protein [Actinomyces radicidentis]|nr:hypothetical protein [Actinomyces radicidentis]